jgi:hypothetical protein
LVGGITFTSYPARGLQTDARYACYPTESTWYIAAGSFPNPPPPPPAASNSTKKATRARKFELQNADGSWNTEAYRTYGVHTEGAKATLGDGYAAAISKTTDGGRTWTTQFAQNNTFYFNEIDCFGADLCCAAGESSGSATPGVLIYCTTDGGATWTKNYELDSVVSSLPPPFLLSFFLLARAHAWTQT